MKLIVIGFVLFQAMVISAFAADQVIELSKGSVPAGHISIFCVSGYKFASAAFCGANGCGITMVQIMGKGNQPVSCQ